MRTLVFVYGTLKGGHRNFHVNEGVRVPGEFETVTRFPLYLVGPRRLPWLVADPGVGHHVVGELYDVDPQALERLDELEQVDDPDWYVRSDLLVRRRDSEDDSIVAAQVYFGRPERLQTDVVHAGPIAEFTFEHEP